MKKGPRSKECNTQKGAIWKECKAKKCNSNKRAKWKEYNL